MPDPKSQADPPMEEILATVRRIIAEDESGTSTPSGASTASGTSTPSGASTASGTSIPSGTSTPPSASTLSGTSTLSATSALSGASTPTAGGDVLELTEVLEADGSIRHIPPFGTALRGPGERREPALGDGRIEPAAPSLGEGGQQNDRPSLRASEASAESEPHALAAVVPPAEPLDLATDETATGTEPQPPLATDRALESLVRDMLRPMLQRWLDENLPALVEDAVRAEVARTSGDPATPRRATRARAKTKPE